MNEQEYETTLRLLDRVLFLVHQESQLPAMRQEPRQVPLADEILCSKIPEVCCEPRRDRSGRPPGQLLHDAWVVRLPKVRSEISNTHERSVRMATDSILANIPIDRAKNANPFPHLSLQGPVFPHLAGLPLQACELWWFFLRHLGLKNHKPIQRVPKRRGRKPL